MGRKLAWAPLEIWSLKRGPRRRCGLQSTPTQAPHLGPRAPEALAPGCTLGCGHETGAPDTADPWEAKAQDLKCEGNSQGKLGSLPLSPSDTPSQPCPPTPWARTVPSSVNHSSEPRIPKVLKRCCLLRRLSPSNYPGLPNSPTFSQTHSGSPLLQSFLRLLLGPVAPLPSLAPDPLPLVISSLPAQSTQPEEVYLRGEGGGGRRQAA